MRPLMAVKDAVVAACVAAVLSAVVASGAMAAAPIYLCVAEKAGGAVKSGGSTSGSCKAKYTQVAMPSEAAEQEKLLDILPYVKYESEGIDKKPTIQISGVNVQVISGAGSEEATPNGEGNVIIGYEQAGTQTGSNNLMMGAGTYAQTYTSFGSIIGGVGNSSLGAYSAVFGGGNTVSGNDGSSVTGGEMNTAGAGYASVSGGSHNDASGIDSSVSGGSKGEATTKWASVSGGSENKATAEYAWVGGGFENFASGKFASVFGGKQERATGPYEARP